MRSLFSTLEIPVAILSMVCAIYLGVKILTSRNKEEVTAAWCCVLGLLGLAALGTLLR